MRTTTETTNEQKVHEIIMEQINYRRLAVMVGGWNPCYGTSNNGDEYFSFRFKAKSTANYCKITLNRATDTYTVYFCKIRGINILNDKEYTLIYADQLEALFANYTRLATRL